MTPEPTLGLGITRPFLSYGIATVIFLALDALWLGVITRGFYRQHIGHLLAPDVNWAAAVLFYALFLGGMVLFVIGPAIEAGSAARALVYGAIFGLVCYATYDLTNHATMRDWPVLVTVVDLAWGTVVSATVSFLTYQVVVRLR